ncbi:late control D family protein [Devosia sp. 919]|uniref:phage late control D family protein n=1 Tax=Devosia sp. 919 TaxID=2726065 RepID=UPI001554AA2F|nr:late control D family protein [Devosia sp. 919]
MAWTVSWKVFVDGQDMTDGMRPFLTGITVSDKDGTASDTCSLDFDDSGGQLKLPKDGAKVQVYLQGAAVFSGTVDTVRSSGSRGSGRTLKVTAKGFDAKGKVKEPQSHHMDDATLQQFLGKAARRAGLSMVIDPALAEITRDYWSADASSFLHMGQKLARELGATFKIRGDKAVLAKRGTGESAGGGTMPIVVGRVPGNVISWDIAPLTTRRSFKSGVSRYFDRPSASFKSVSLDTEIEGADAINEVRSLAADEGQAQGIAEGRKSDSKREGGEGTVELDLEVTAQAEGTFMLSGARPGVDGSYRIAGVTHKADRGGGSTTSLDLKQPEGGAGKDDR